MALIVVTGLPCSGRTTRSLELRDYFTTQLAASSSSSSTPLPSRVLHLTNASLHLPRTVYASQLSEKPARAAFLSHAIRSLSPDAIVIADGGAGTNIKGFRYQLWCAARENGVRCVNVMCASEGGRCRKRWERRRNVATGGQKGHGWRPAPLDDDEGGDYDEKTFDELLQRYEEPSDMVRWDKPLFVVADGGGAAAGPDGQGGESSENDREEWETLPFQDIWEAAIVGKAEKAPTVVTPIRATTSNYLSQLETSTQIVLSSLSTSLSTTPNLSGPIKLPLPSLSLTLDMVLPPSTALRPPTLPALQRLRRQFVKMHSKGFATTNELGKAAKREGGSTVVGTTTTTNGEVEGGTRKGVVVGQRLGRRAPVAVPDKAREEAPQGDTTATKTTGKPGEDVDDAAEPPIKASEGRTAEQSIAERFVAWLEEALVIGVK